SMVMFFGPPPMIAIRPGAGLAGVPHRVFTSDSTLLRIVMFSVCWLGARLSYPQILNAAATCRMMLFCTTTSRITLHGAVLLWFRGTITMAYPCWPEAQLFSIVLPSITTRCAFLSSTRFFTVHDCDIHAVFFVIRFLRIVMSLGTRLAIA